MLDVPKLYTPLLPPRVFLGDHTQVPGYASRGNSSFGHRDDRFDRFFFFVIPSVFNYGHSIYVSTEQLCFVCYAISRTKPTLILMGGNRN